MACLRKPTFFATESTRVTLRSVPRDCHREPREAGAGPRVEDRQGPGVERSEYAQGVENVLVRHLDRIEDGGEVDAGAPPAELIRQPRQRVRLRMGQGEPQCAAPLHQHSRNRRFLHRHSETHCLQAPGRTQGSRWHDVFPRSPTARPAAPSERRCSSRQRWQPIGHPPAPIVRNACPPPRKPICHDFDRNTSHPVGRRTFESTRLSGKRRRPERAFDGPWATRSTWNAGSSSPSA